MSWTRKPQEQPGKYFFSGQFYVTKGVSESLTLEEITWICLDLKAFVKEQNGIDYLQVYECTDGRKVWFIDQLDEAMIASGEYEPGDNHCTLLLPEEYWISLPPDCRGSIFCKVRCKLDYSNRVNRFHRLLKVI